MNLLAVAAVGLGAFASVYGLVSIFTRYLTTVRAAMFVFGVAAVIWGHLADDPATGPLSGLTNLTTEFAQAVVLLAGVVLGWKKATE